MATQFIGKKFSEKLDGNLSIALAGEIEVFTTLSCVLFMVDGKTMIASFMLDIVSEDLCRAMSEGTLFTIVENLYLGMEQGMKNANENVCLH